LVRKRPLFKDSFFSLLKKLKIPIVKNKVNNLEDNVELKDAKRLNNKSSLF